MAPAAKVVWWTRTARCPTINRTHRVPPASHGRGGRQTNGQRPPQFGIIRLLPVSVAATSGRASSQPRFGAITVPSCGLQQDAVKLSRIDAFMFRVYVSMQIPRPDSTRSINPILTGGQPHLCGAPWRAGKCPHAGCPAARESPGLRQNRSPESRCSTGTGPSRKAPNPRRSHSVANGQAWRGHFSISLDCSRTSLLFRPPGLPWVRRFVPGLRDRCRVVRRATQGCARAAVNGHHPAGCYPRRDARLSIPSR